MGVAIEILPSPAVSPCPSKPLVQLPVKRSNKKRVRIECNKNVEHTFEKDYTDNDLASIWYTPEEFAAIKSKIHTMIRSVHDPNNWITTTNTDGKMVTTFQPPKTTSNNIFEEENNNNSNEDYHWRGFEHILERRSRKECRKSYIRNLLHFSEFANDDPIALEIFSKTQNMEAIQRAQELAAFDEMEALEIHNEPSAVSSEEEKMIQVDLSDNLTSDEKLSNLKENQSTQPPAPLYICRNDENHHHDVTQVDSLNLSLLENKLSQMQDSNLLFGSTICPWQLVAMIFPCMD